MDKKKQILEFIRQNRLAVVSTIDSKESRPEAALVVYSETENLELIFATFSDSRKYENLQKNQKVALVIGGWDEDITVQYEGIAKELEGADVEEYRKIHLAKNPESEEYAYDEKQRFFKVTPTWIRYSDLTKEPPEIFEISL